MAREKCVFITVVVVVVVVVIIIIIINIIIMHFTVVKLSDCRATVLITSVGAALVCTDVTVVICLTVTCTHCYRRRR